VSEDPLLVILTLTPTFIIISLISSKIIYMKRLKGFRPLFMILLAPGIVLHEVSHYIMCRSLGVRVQKLRLLEVDKYWHLSGYVIPDPIQNSFFKPFLISVAPSVVNTILACLLILVAPYFTEPWIEILLSWLVASFILCCGPSRDDLAFALRPIIKYPRNTLKEFGYLTVGILTGLVLYRVSLMAIGVELPPFLVAICSLLAMIVANVVLKQK
jgi:hypothetical protein